MSLTLYVGIFVGVFLLGALGYFAYGFLRGPASLEELELLFKRGQYQQVIGELQKLLEQDETHKRARLLLAQALQKKGDHSAAVLEFRQAIKGKGAQELRRAVVHQGLAESLTALGRMNEARDEYLLWTQAEPANAEPFYRVGEIYSRSNDMTKAIGFLTRATQINARQAEALQLLGQCHYQMQAYQDARAALLQAVKLRPDFPLASYFLGLTLRYLGDHEWALKELEKAEKSEDVRVKAILAKGMVLIDAGNFSRAMMELDRGVKFAPAGTEVSFNMRYLLAQAAEKNRDISKAIENWEIIENLKPGFRDVRQKLKEYSEYRIDDNMKDFMIASRDKFEAAARKLVEGMGYAISSLTLINDTLLVCVALEPESGKRTRRQNTYFHICRDLDPLSEATVRDVQEKMRESHSARAIILTAGDVSSMAADYVSSRPIEIYERSRMAELFKSVP